MVTSLRSKWAVGKARGGRIPLHFLLPGTLGLVAIIIVGRHPPHHPRHTGKNEHQRKCLGVCPARTDFKGLARVHKTAGICERGLRLYLRDSRSSSSATRCSNLPASLGSRLAMRSSSTANSSSSSPPAIICNRLSRVISAFLNVP
jgi:hypothetical protein